MGKERSDQKHMRAEKSPLRASWLSRHDPRPEARPVAATVTREPVNGKSDSANTETQARFCTMIRISPNMSRAIYSRKTNTAGKKKSDQPIEFHQYPGGFRIVPPNVEEPSIETEKNLLHLLTSLDIKPLITPKVGASQKTHNSSRRKETINKRMTHHITTRDSVDYSLPDMSNLSESETVRFGNDSRTPKTKAQKCRLVVSSYIPDRMESKTNADTRQMAQEDIDGTPDGIANRTVAKRNPSHHSIANCR
nr:hypothetical protein Iba_chr06fCG8380 [Ipomoea batatas]